MEIKMNSRILSLLSEQQRWENLPVRGTGSGDPGGYKDFEGISSHFLLCSWSRKLREVPLNPQFFLKLAIYVYIFWRFSSIQKEKKVLPLVLL